jgi:ATP-dependent DNA helicase RecQ
VVHTAETRVTIGGLRHRDTEIAVFAHTRLEELSLVTPESAKQVLRQSFLLDSFRPGQEEVIEILLDGRSAAAIFPTGSGKSLCYQLPALMLPGLTLVVSPLLALMKDQIDGLKQLDVAAERLDSSLDDETYRNVTEAIRSGDLKLLFVAPERLGNERFLNLIQGQRVSLLAVDEAHCISSWGHNFRPDYLKVASAARELGVERVVALTATATPQVASDIAEAFGIQPADVVNTGFYRSNLELRVSGCTDSQRPELLVTRLRERPPGPTIVYVSLQRHAEETAEHLVRSGYNARPYHAGLSSEERVATQDAFMSGEVPIVCATIAFGMGVDKPDIRYVYHYHLAKGYESYMQEIGRAGRDGKVSICELFACADDVTTLENFAYGDTPDAESVRSLTTELLESGERFDVSVPRLSAQHDMRRLVVSTLLTRLELAGILRSEGHHYEEVRFAPELSEDEILSRYQPRQAELLRQVFSCGSTARTWVTLDMRLAMQRTGHDRSVILRGLDDLYRKNLIKLKLGGYVQRFRRLRAEVDLDATCESLIEAFEHHEHLEIGRIESVLAYAQSDTCLTARLLEYFGEKIGSCGHCGICRGEAPAEVGARCAPQFSLDDRKQFEQLIDEHPEALGRARQQARFLCGLNSPAVSKAKELRGSSMFGECRQVPFREVLDALQGRYRDPLLA